MELKYFPAVEDKAFGIGDKFNYDSFKLWIERQQFNFGYSFTVGGDILSSNWDGASPLDLSASDSAATAGFALDSSEGAIQTVGNVYVGGELQFFDRLATEAADYWILDRSATDNFRITFHDNAGATTRNRFIIKDEGGIEFYDEGETLRLDFSASSDRWLFGGKADMGGNDLQGLVDLYDNQGTKRKRMTVNASGISLYDADGSTERLGIVNDGNFNIKDKSGNVVFQYDDALGAIQADDGSTGQRTIFPFGTIITQGTASSGTSISNPSGSMARLAATVQTIACDYANQPVNVEVWVSVVWSGMSTGTNYVVNCGINNTNYGQNQALRVAYAAKTSDSDSHTHSVSTTGGSHSHNVSGATATASGHAHNAGSLVGDATTHSHSTTTGSDGHSHSTDIVVDNQQVTAMYVSQGSDGITANGSGNVTVSIFAQGDGAADIEGWQITWKITRR